MKMSMKGKYVAFLYITDAAFFVLLYFGITAPTKVT